MKAIAFPCPNCSGRTQAYATAPEDGGRRRNRKCMAGCGYKFRTIQPNGQPEIVTGPVGKKGRPSRSCKSAVTRPIKNTPPQGAPSTQRAPSQRVQSRVKRPQFKNFTPDRQHAIRNLLRDLRLCLTEARQEVSNERQ